MHNIPLAERMRPNKISDIIGQKHLIGEEGVLKIAIEKKIIPSMILWGPPGVGKTTLANLLADELERPFYTLSAINSGVKDIRDIIKKAESLGLFGKNNPILFIDEIHRFSKSQQDSLLGAVEKGIITLIGATTENPSFEIISALLSRSQIYILKSLTEVELKLILEEAIQKDSILKKQKIILKELDAIIQLSDGDARKLLNILELVIGSIDHKEMVINNDVVAKIVQKNIIRYDKNGDQHYDIISAFIKSIRGSDPNAAIYWLARMIDGGEDIKFIARRLIILASEDIGNANPTALVIANNCFQAITVTGLPEARIILSQAVIYLACSAKSNSSYNAINKALEEVKKSGNLSVPLHLKNSANKLMKELGHGKDYIYSHKKPLSEQEFLPEKISGMTIYNPGNNQRENEFRNELINIWKQKYKY